MPTYTLAPEWPTLPGRFSRDLPRCSPSPLAIGSSTVPWTPAGVSNHPTSTAPPAGWLTFGFHADLNEATLLALADMLELLAELYGIARPEALALASVVVDLRMTQIANGVHGVHAVLPHGAIR